MNLLVVLFTLHENLSVKLFVLIVAVFIAVHCESVLCLLASVVAALYAVAVGLQLFAPIDESVTS